MTFGNVLEYYSRDTHTLTILLQFFCVDRSHISNATELRVSVRTSPVVGESVLAEFHGPLRFLVLTISTLLFTIFTTMTWRPKASIQTAATS